jgi:predicted TIM-barrel fold metal-dependent hydrolase
MIFDTHLHLIDRGRLRYPWLAGAPALDRDWDYPAYARVAQRVGISDVLHMEVDVDAADIEAETAMVARLMDAPGSLIRGAISAARPESPDFAAWLGRLDRRVVKGLRRVLHVVPDDVSQGAAFRDGIRRLGPAGLPFDLCLLARQLPLGLELARAAPETVFVLDHCGGPDIAGGGHRAWAAALAPLAACPNVTLKLSGITANAGGGWRLATLRPYVDTVLDLFGPGRMVWGSDSPVCTLHSDLAEWVAACQALLAPCTAEERAAIFLGNARRIWAIGG